MKSNYFYSVIIFSFLFVYNLNAQTDTWLPAKGILGGNVRSITIDRLNENIIYCSLVGKFYKSIDGGISWTEIEIPLYTVNEIIQPPDLPGTLFIAGGSSIYKSIDQGENWEEIYVAEDEKYVNSITYNPLNNNTFYGASHSGLIYKSFDCGKNWIELNTGSFLTVSTVAVSAIDSNLVLAGINGGMDYIYGGIYRSIDGGFTWEMDSLTNFHIYTIVFDPESPEYIYAGTEKGLYTSLDNGLTWVNTNKGGLLKQILFTGKKNHHLIAVDLSFGLYETHATDTIWNKIDGEFPNSSTISIPYNDTTFFYSGNYYGLFKGNYDGNQFKLLGVEPIAVNVLCEDLLESEVIYAGGSRFYTSIDDGDTWNLNKIGVCNDALCIDPDNPKIFYGANYGNVGLKISKDKGESWTNILEDVSLNDVAISNTNPHTVFTGGLADARVGGLYRSNDCGGNWDTLGGKLDNAVVYKITVNPLNQNCVLVGTHNQGLFRSYDLGESWSQVNSGLPIGEPDSDFIFDIVYDPKDTSTIYLSIGTLGVYKTTNAGADWQEINNGLTSLYVRSILIDPENTDNLFAGTYWGGVFISSNGGSNWQPINNGLDINFPYGVTIRDLILNKDNGYTLLAATGSGVWKYQFSSVDVEETENQISESFILCQNYPNPFNPTTKINYSIPAVETSHGVSITLKVYNLLGQEITTLVNKMQSPGNYQVDFDASSLASGVYVYRLQAENYTNSRKMLLIR